MFTAAERKRHERWLLQVTGIPTAAGCEGRVVAWVHAWLRSRPDLRVTADPAGNLLIADRRLSTAARPILLTAHLDHPAFVMRRVIEPGTVELEFRGGVHDPYFEAARLDIFDRRNRAHAARVESLDSAAKPFKRVVARLEGRGASLRTGDVGRWALSGGGKPAIAQGHLHAPACDDLAAVAAALSCLDLLCRRGAGAAAGLLLTVAEEVGFIGAIAACKHKTIPRRARLVCLENSRSFAESPVGAGPIVRVGDRMSVFTPDLTNAVALLATEHQKANPGFRFQRRLMPGGTCEATAFASYGYASTCLCLPLGNYHNMADIDGVQAGARPALVAPEFISIDDYHGLIELLMAVVTGLDAAPGSPLRRRMEDLYRDVGPAVLVTSTTRRR